jgi:hypothetical protein
LAVGLRIGLGGAVHPRPTVAPDPATPGPFGD